MRVKFIVWDVERARPVNDKPLRPHLALALADAKELKHGRHFVTVPA